MKLTPLKLGFGVAVLVHGIALGAMLANGFLQPAALQLQNTRLTLTLVTAPREPDSTPAAQTATPQQPVPSHPIEPAQPKAEEIPAPVELVKPTAMKEPPVSPTPASTRVPSSPILVEAKPALQATPDGGPIQPTAGRDAMDAPGQPELKAGPSYSKNPPPVYPLLARRRRQEGLVVLSVKVTTAGKAESVAIKETSGFPLLDEAAMDAVRDWEFSPARVGSLALRSEIEVPVRFELAP